MNKFLSKLTSATLGIMISFVPVKTEAGVVSNFCKLIINSVGLGLSIYGYTKLDKDLDNGRSQNTIKYALAATAIFSVNIVTDLYNIASDSSSSKEKDKLGRKIEQLEMENSILRSTKK